MFNNVTHDHVIDKMIQIQDGGENFQPLQSGKVREIEFKINVLPN